MFTLISTQKVDIKIPSDNEAFPESLFANQQAGCGDLHRETGTQNGSEKQQNKSRDPCGQAAACPLGRPQRLLVAEAEGTIELQNHNFHYKEAF